MGYLKRRVKRALVPKSVRRASHPVSSVKHALTPRPVKTVKRVAWKAANPLSTLGDAAEKAAVDALIGKPGKRKGLASAPAPSTGSATETLGTGGGATARAAYTNAVAEQVTSILSMHRRAVPAAARPTAAPPPPVDRDAIRDDMAPAILGVVPVWRLDRRREARRVLALETERRTRAEGIRRRDQQIAEQNRLDAEWQLLVSNDSGHVMTALGRSLNQVDGWPISAAGDAATIAVRVPLLQEIVPDHMPTTSPSGRRTIRSATKDERHSLYFSVIASSILLAARTSFSCAPSLSRVTVLVLRGAPVAGAVARLEPVWVGSLSRVGTLARDLRGNRSIEILDDALDELSNPRFETRGNAHQVVPLRITSDPELAILMPAACAVAGAVPSC